MPRMDPLALPEICSGQELCWSHARVVQECTDAFPPLSPLPACAHLPSSTSQKCVSVFLPCMPHACPMRIIAALHAWASLLVWIGSSVRTFAGPHFGVESYCFHVLGMRLLHHAAGTRSIRAGIS